jgi:hypothetical protein
MSGSRDQTWTATRLIITLAFDAGLCPWERTEEKWPTQQGRCQVTTYSCEALGPLV